MSPNTEYASPINPNTLRQSPVPTYQNFSRGYKTKGNSYKDRYLKGVVRCPECDNDSVYKDEWSQTISYKCMSRKCKHNWFVKKEFPIQE